LEASKAATDLIYIKSVLSEVDKIDNLQGAVMSILLYFQIVFVGSGRNVGQPNIKPAIIGSDRLSLVTILEQTKDSRRNN